MMHYQGEVMVAKICEENNLIYNLSTMGTTSSEEIGNQAKNAYYRLGLSATPFRTDNQEIRIEGTPTCIRSTLVASSVTRLGYFLKVLQN